MIVDVYMFISVFQMSQKCSLRARHLVFVLLNNPSKICSPFTYL